MIYQMTEKQKESFKSISGYDYDGTLKGGFATEYPYNDREWKLSPWYFSFVFNQDDGNFVCELRHRMTNNRIYGWNQEGIELSDIICEQYFTAENDFVVVTSE